MNSEDDFPGTLVIDEQVELRLECIRPKNFQFTDNFGGSGGQFGKIEVGALRTEATIPTSASRQA
jgi:hypothetical protein